MKKYCLIVAVGLLMLAGLALLMPNPRPGAAEPEEVVQTETITPAAPYVRTDDFAQSGEPKADKPILVNAHHPIEDDDSSELVSVFDYMTDSYFVSGTDVLVRPEVMEPLNEMMDAFYSETGLHTILIESAYRSIELQRELFEEKAAEVGEEEAERWVNRPGYSEHHTGLALDIGLFYEEDGSCGEFDGKGEYAWFAEHAPEYGFILRYPEGKESLTGVAYEPWHFRYVGVEHAKAMTEAGQTLEEYVFS